MAKGPVREPPPGYAIFRVDPRDGGRFYVYRRDADAFVPIRDEEGHHISYAKRWQAVHFLERRAEKERD